MTERQKPRTEKITLWGIVQGVGFRPFVAKLARRMGLQGEVRNTGGLVEILLSDTAERIDAFLEALSREKPDPAEIVHVRRERISDRTFDGFQICDSRPGREEAAMLPADIAMCEHCLREFHDPENRRFLHPYNSCMICGPRYTIIDRIPYDRNNTAMADFTMCGRCEEEYTGIEDRRYHAQTVSCHDCGPFPIYLENPQHPRPAPASGIHIEGLSAVALSGLAPVIGVARGLRGGNIYALKGMGGYYLVCDATNPAVVGNLRRLKGREEKPFAVMFRDLDQVRRYCRISPEEASLLCSSARPILLLERYGPADGAAPIAEETYRSSRYMGTFLPSMGIQHLLLEGDMPPLIMTSANCSDQPIIREEEEMQRFIARQPMVAGMLYHTRDIRVRVDDSVVRFIDGRPQMIRRSKGYAPVPLYVNGLDTLTDQDMIFAAGGQLKAAFTLTKGPLTYVSQYFGDLDTCETQAVYEENVRRMADLFRIRPGLVVCDLHPRYASTQFARTYAASLTREPGGPAGEAAPENLLCVQHHHAHVASVMAEHGLSGPVIGVSFDGTGYGTDGSIWGGEFLICEADRFERRAHLKPVSLIGGDSSMKEGWKSALCYLYAWQNGYASPGDADQVGKADPGGDGQESKTEEIIVNLEDIISFGDLSARPEWPQVQAALVHGINTIKSSGMGRLFEAVAAFLGIQDVNRYEGECAVMLENAAAEALRHPGRDRAADLALQFHRDIAWMILRQCEALRRQTGVAAVCLSGGVFQNQILMEESLRLLRESGFEVYYNISVPPNDGGISLGQAFLGMQALAGRKEKERKR